MAGLAARATVDCMRQDPTFKDIFAYPFMVEELLRWFVAGIPGGRELVDGLDFSRLLRGCRSSPLRDRRRVSAPTLTTSSGGCRSVSVATITGTRRGCTLC